jgi:hypothetical protein
MITTTTYECEVCGKEFYKQESAEECEQSHLEEIKMDIEKLHLVIAEGEEFEKLGYDAGTFNDINKTLLSKLYDKLAIANRQ